MKNHKTVSVNIPIDEWRQLKTFCSDNQVTIQRFMMTGFYLLCAADNFERERLLDETAQK